MPRSLLCLFVVSMCSPTSAADSAPVDFRTDVLPLLADRCFACHGPDADTREADLRFDRRESVFGNRETPLLVPGKPQASELYLRISSSDPDVHMPPPDATRQLTAEEIELIRVWIEQGAEWQEHWSFQPIERPPVPITIDPEWTRNPIDNFVLSRLDSEKLAPSPEADRTRLIRRVTLVLTGLPPTPDEIDSFLADTAPGAYERLVDRLLASHRYGEHFARAWMDAARYADTDGYQNDRTRYMWVWRDWLIRALNEGKPFDEFTIEQLAGDMLPDATLFQQIATGFSRNHRINSEGGSIPEEWIVEYVVDRVDTLGTVWLGLTVGCARCHDHKYDPVAQRDYYSLFAYFNNVPEWGLGPNNGNSPPFIEVPANWPNLRPEQNRKITPLPPDLVTTQTSVVRPKPGGAKTVMVMHELDKPRPTYLLQRGQYDSPDKSEVLSPSLPQSLNLSDSAPKNRLELARWLVDPANPLTARVTVNRHWQHFFGTGLVRTTENLGTQGEQPSHPQLLDWLASELLRINWDMKQLHRLIVTSATFRQSSSTSAKLRRLDPENRLLARGPRMRLTAHMIRDQALAASGLLVERIGGPSVKPYMPPRIWRSISNNKYEQGSGPDLYRRSLYTYWRRTIPPPTMMAFNSSDREVCLVRKDQTNTPLQALTLMNNVAFVEAARFLAERMLREGGSNPIDQMRHGFRLVVGRWPGPEEVRPLEETFEILHEHYAAHPDAAVELLGIGERPRDKRLDPVDHAALTMVANVVLNLDETVTLE
jgi:mono/diheme cytochrome c family protein